MLSRSRSAPPWPLPLPLREPYGRLSLYRDRTFTTPAPFPFGWCGNAEVVAPIADSRGVRVRDSWGQWHQVVIRIFAATVFGLQVMPVSARFGGDCRMTVCAFARLSAVKILQKITSDKLSDHFLLLTTLKTHFPLRVIHIRRRFDARGAFCFHRSVPDALQLVFLSKMEMLHAVNLIPHALHFLVYLPNLTHLSGVIVQLLRHYLLLLLSLFAFVRFFRKYETFFPATTFLH